MNIGTRFLAAEEAGVDEGWKQRIVRSASDEAVKVEFAEAAFAAAPPGGYDVKPRVLRTPFVDDWNSRVAEAGASADRVRGELGAAIAEGRAHELVPFTGQTVGLIDEVLPAAEIIRRMVAEAEQLLQRAPTLSG